LKWIDLTVLDDVVGHPERWVLAIAYAL